MRSDFECAPFRGFAKRSNPGHPNCNWIEHARSAAASARLREEELGEQDLSDGGDREDGGVADVGEFVPRLLGGEAEDGGLGLGAGQHADQQAERDPQDPVSDDEQRSGRRQRHEPAGQKDEDAAAVAEVTGAAAVSSAGEAMPVAFIGRGLALQEQGVPLQFRILTPPPGLSVGTPVTVTVQTARRVNGIVLPQDAVVRSTEGPPMVFEKASAERFVPRPVRVEPLDGTRVVVLGGIDSGRLVVTEGAGLIAQVR